MLKVIAEIIYQVTGKKNITYDTDFVKDLALNSLDVMNIISAFEDRYNVRVPTRDIWKMRQVRDVVEYMRKKGIDCK